MNEKILEITIQLRKKYNKISELMDLTKEMADSLQRNDMVSFDLLLNMRTDIILDIDDISNKIQSIVQSLDTNVGERINLILHKPDITIQTLSPLEQKLHDIVSESARLIRRLIALDEIVNKKISGKDSFYQT